MSNVDFYKALGVVGVSSHLGNGSNFYSTTFSTSQNDVGLWVYLFLSFIVFISNSCITWNNE